MQKAYDFKLLAKKLKDRGLDVAEEAIVIILEESFDWLSESALVSDNKFDDLGVAVYPVIKKYILEKADKIDGEDDEGR